MNLLAYGTIQIEKSADLNAPCANLLTTIGIVLLVFLTLFVALFARLILKDVIRLRRYRIVSSILVSFITVEVFLFVVQYWFGFAWMTFGFMAIPMINRCI